MKIPRQARTAEPWAYLEAAEQTALLTCEAIPEPDRLMIAFAIGTGLRSGEQAPLLRHDVHLGDDAHVVVR